MPTLQRPNYLAPAGNPFGGSLTAGLGVSQPPRISLADDRFTVVLADGRPDPRLPQTLDLIFVVVGANEHASRMYYDQPYDAKDAIAPACFSDNGEAPSANAQRPQAETCAVCPQARWGSKLTPNGEGIPACSTLKKLAVLDVRSPDTVLLLSIPPASLKNWRNYVNHLESLQAGPQEIMTKATMHEKILHFEPVDWIPQNAVPIVQAAMASADVLTVTNAHDKPRALGLPAPAGYSPAQLQTPAAPPAGFGQPAPQQPAPAPVGPQFGGFGQPMPQQPTNAAPVGQPAEPTRSRRPRQARQGETVVGPGPIPAGTFQQPAAQPPAGFNGFGGAPAPAAPQGQPTGSAGPAFGVQHVAGAVAEDVKAQLDNAFAMAGMTR